MNVILNTIADKAVVEQLAQQLSDTGETAVFDTCDMNIHHCIGCNHCFLKTPGICSIKDDFEQILRKAAYADNIWLISETSFGFINSKGKKVMDRILPLLNMWMEFREGIMRHTLRYTKKDVGLVFVGEGNQELLDFWCQRTAGNLGGLSLGAFSSDRIEEVNGKM